VTMHDTTAPDTPVPQQLTDELRQTFAGMSDVLIPRSGPLPSAREVGVHEEAIDRLLALRPDLKERFLRGLAACHGQDPEQAARRLNETDPTALAAIGLFASAAYYIDPKVRELIGYPGQTARTYDPDETPGYMVNGQLQRVIDRGPIYRPTPR